jgi:hypothetical protein
MIALAFVREYGATLLEVEFRLDFSRSGWALSGLNTSILFIGFFVLLIFVLFPICVSSFGNLMRDEWARKTGLPPDQNPLEFFEIRKRNGNV